MPIQCIIISMVALCTSKNRKCHNWTLLFINILIFKSIFFLVSGGTPVSEVRLEEKRNALRRAMKREFMRQGFNTKNHDQDVGKRAFDTALMRFHAFHNTMESRVVLNSRHFMLFFATIIVPIGLISKYHINRKVSCLRIYRFNKKTVRGID